MDAGFYNYANGKLTCAPNAVHFPDGSSLKKETKGESNGWKWFDTIAAACTEYEVNAADYAAPVRGPRRV